MSVEIHAENVAVHLRLLDPFVVQKATFEDAAGGSDLEQNGVRVSEVHRWRFVIRRFRRRQLLHFGANDGFQFQRDTQMRVRLQLDVADVIDTGQGQIFEYG